MVSSNYGAYADLGCNNSADFEGGTDKGLIASGATMGANTKKTQLCFLLRARARK
jgi:hypothetical protein